MLLFCILIVLYTLFLAGRPIRFAPESLAEISSFEKLLKSKVVSGSEISVALISFDCLRSGSL